MGQLVRKVSSWTSISIVPSAEIEPAGVHTLAEPLIGDGDEIERRASVARRLEMDGVEELPFPIDRESVPVREIAALFDSEVLEIAMYVEVSAWTSGSRCLANTCSSAWATG